MTGIRIAGRGPKAGSNGCRIWIGSGHARFPGRYEIMGGQARPGKVGGEAVAAHFGDVVEGQRCWFRPQGRSMFSFAPSRKEHAMDVRALRTALAIDTAPM